MPKRWRKESEQPKRRAFARPAVVRHASLMNKILVVDDDRATRVRLAAGLKKWGHEVVTVADGKEAWERVREDGIQFVISDWIMPGMSGLELLDRIRSGPAVPYVYFILLTSKTDRDHLVEGMEAGADDFLAKPFDPEELRVRVRAGQRLLDLENDLQVKNQELSAFTSVASHDLREPLRTISTYLMLLQRKYGGELDEQADEYIRFVTDAAKRMSNLVSELLDYARLDAGEMEFEEVRTEELCKELRKELQASIAESGATLTFGDLPIVQANRTQLRQVFQNLIGNAIKYRGEEPPSVHVAAEEHDGAWRFSVHDNGIGIDREHRQRVFEPFQRLHGLSSEYSGSGVGLAICKRVVEKHGGEIWVEPNPAGGSVFRFTLSHDAEAGRGRGRS